MQQFFPIFPLHAHILPGGMLTLRIFEQKYKRMVRDVCKEEGGFGVCMLPEFFESGDHCHILPIGTFVKIVDFDALPNNVLGITVKGIHKFHLIASHLELDGLLIGETEVISNWEQTEAPEDFPVLVEKLKAVFAAFPFVSQLYTHKAYDDTTWVTQRLIELLPFESELKQELIAAKDCRPSVDFLLNSYEVTHSDI